MLLCAASNYLINYFVCEFKGGSFCGVGGGGGGVFVLFLSRRRD